MRDAIRIYSPWSVVLAVALLAGCQSDRCDQTAQCPIHVHCGDHHHPDGCDRHGGRSDAGAGGERPWDQIPDEQCNAADDDADGLVDEGYDLMSDPHHCGACGRHCAAPNADPICAEGACGLAGCADGWTDLDGRWQNGCEYACGPAIAEWCNEADDDCDGAIDEGIELGRDPDNCGACGIACAPPNGHGACESGSCRVVGCDEGFVDLDGDPDNGCEYACLASPDGETCDGTDEDCDGRVDELLEPPPADVQLGQCAGAGKVCRGDMGWDEPDYAAVAWAWQGEEQTCDGLDNDCDGETDEGLVGCVPCADGDPDAVPCNGCPVDVSVPDGMVCIPAGDGMIGRSPNEQPAIGQPSRRYTLTYPFLMDTTETTLGEWAEVASRSAILRRDVGSMDDCGDECPVDAISWYEILDYANERSRLAGLPTCYERIPCEGEEGFDRSRWRCFDFAGLACPGYRLPTSAEWEYGARAGTFAWYWWGDEHDLRCANERCEGWTIYPVAGMSANPWGLYDTLGNALEWCFDDGIYPANADEVDPVYIGPGSEYRVVRLPNANSAEFGSTAAQWQRKRGIIGYARYGFRLARTVRPRQ